MTKEKQQFFHDGLSNGGILKVAYSDGVIEYLDYDPKRNLVHVRSSLSDPWEGTGASSGNIFPTLEWLESLKEEGEVLDFSLILN